MIITVGIIIKKYISRRYKPFHIAAYNMLNKDCRIFPGMYPENMSFAIDFVCKIIHNPPNDSVKLARMKRVLIDSIRVKEVIPFVSSIIPAMKHLAISGALEMIGLIMVRSTLNSMIHTHIVAIVFAELVTASEIEQFDCFITSFCVRLFFGRTIAVLIAERI